MVESMLNTRTCYSAGNYGWNLNVWALPCWIQNASPRIVYLGLYAYAQSLSSATSTRHPTAVCWCQWCTSKSWSLIPTLADSLFFSSFYTRDAWRIIGMGHSGWSRHLASPHHTCRWFLDALWLCLGPSLVPWTHWLGQCRAEKS